MVRHRAAFLLLLLGLLASCAPTHYARPLKHGELAITGTLGGSIFDNFGYPLPVPNTTIGAGYGITPFTAFWNPKAGAPASASPPD